MTDLTTASRKLRRLLALPEGWNYGRDGKPSKPALIGAVFALQHLNALGAERFDVLPAADFGVTIMASHGQSVAEITVSSDGQYSFFIERGDEIVADGTCLSFGGLIDALEAEGWQSLKSSGSHTRSSTVWYTAGSQAKLSGTKARVRQSFARIVEPIKAAHFVHILPGSIEDWEANRPFSSGSRSRPLVMEQG